MKNKTCFFSSLIFLINAIIAYKNKYYKYSLAFIFLVITSLFHHYYCTKLTRNIDRTAVLIISYFTVLIYYNKKNKITLGQNIYLGIGCFSIFYIFIYGYFANKYSFDTNHEKSCLWHSLLHIIACIISISIILI